MAPFNGTAEQAFIKEEIRGAGYSGVNSLMRDADGTWHARAYKGPAEVFVAVDRSGHISENPSPARRSNCESWSCGPRASRSLMNPAPRSKRA